MPGVDIGAILSAVGGMLLQALMNAATNTLTQMLTNMISDALYGVADALEGLLGADSWLSDALRTFTENLAAELTGAVSNLLNETNRIAQTAWGIIDSQQRLHEQLTTVIEGSLGDLAHALNVEQEQRYKTGAAITQYLLQFVVRKPQDFERLGRDLFELQQDLVAGDAMRAEDAYKKGFDFVMTYLLADLQAVEQMPEEDLKLAAEFIGAQLQEHMDWVRQWFQNVVVMPITYANAFRSAFTEGVAYTPDEYAEMLLEHQEAVDKAMAKYMERLERRLQEHGEIAR